MVGKKFIDSSWDFQSGSEKVLTHNYHTYPAMMIPPISKRLIQMYGKKSKTILDPFVGSGTVMVEATLTNNLKEAYGTDINPLALLLANVKTTSLSYSDLKKQYEKISAKIKNDLWELNTLQKDTTVPSFKNISFWFKPRIAKELSIIKNRIDEIKDEPTRDFFLVAFSEIVRKVSNSRNGEYKLYRIQEDKLKSHNPNAFEEFNKKAICSIERMRDYAQMRQKCKTNIFFADCREKTPVPGNKIDLIVTSPPYGDSRTTVAYGQFSRLALQWLGYDDKDTIAIDKTCLGGIPTKDMARKFESPSLGTVLDKISAQDERRARDVLSFYADFYKCIPEFDRVLREKANLCFVVGNRTVKNTKIPTDDILVELFEGFGNYKHDKTFIRQIPSKRMPRSNSPTNVKGATSPTMNEEYIVVLKKS